MAKHSKRYWVWDCTKPIADFGWVSPISHHSWSTNWDKWFPSRLASHKNTWNMLKFKLCRTFSRVPNANFIRDYLGIYEVVPIFSSPTCMHRDYEIAILEALYAMKNQRKVGEFLCWDGCNLILGRCWCQICHGSAVLPSLEPPPLGVPKLFART